MVTINVAQAFINVNAYEEYERLPEARIGVLAGYSFWIVKKDDSWISRVCFAVFKFFPFLLNVSEKAIKNLYDKSKQIVHENGGKLIEAKEEKIKKQQETVERLQQQLSTIQNAYQLSNS